MNRYAVIESTDLDAIRAYLPQNYSAKRAGTFDKRILITGSDSAGWTLDDYVIPRLASGLHFAREITEAEREVILEDAMAGDLIERDNLRGITAPDF